MPMPWPGYRSPARLFGHDLARMGRARHRRGHCGARAACHRSRCPRPWQLDPVARSGPLRREPDGRGRDGAGRSPGLGGVRLSRLFDGRRHRAAAWRRGPAGAAPRRRGDRRGSGAVGRGRRRVLDTKVLAAGLRAEDPTTFPAMVQAFRQGILDMGNDPLALAAHADSAARDPDPPRSHPGPDPAHCRRRRPAGRQSRPPCRSHPDVPPRPRAGDHVAARLSPQFTEAVLGFLA